MSTDIFNNTKNFSYTDNDYKAEVRIQECIQDARTALPEEFYSGSYLSYFSVLPSA
jgi:hypothetical protein